MKPGLYTNGDITVKVTGFCVSAGYIHVLFEHDDGTKNRCEMNWFRNVYGFKPIEAEKAR